MGKCQTPKDSTWIDCVGYLCSNDEHNKKIIPMEGSLETDLLVHRVIRRSGHRYICGSTVARTAIPCARPLGHKTATAVRITKAQASPFSYEYRRACRTSTAHGERRPIDPTDRRVASNSSLSPQHNSNRDCSNVSNRLSRSWHNNPPKIARWITTRKFA